jgi:tetratricopeptide (TPR) repeat protein
MEHVEAVALFVERAQDAHSGFTLTERNARVVADICMRLDGLPLAIELAAAKVKLLSLGDLLSRLEHSLQLLTGGARDLPGRHQTLNNAIQSSYDLLGPRLQRIFRGCGVFVAAFVLQAAVSVAGASLDDVAALIDASMVQRQESASEADGESKETRYAMLMTLREFAVQELTARGELGAARQRHADYFTKLADSARSELRGTDRALWMERLTAALEDIRAALSWCIERGSVEGAMRIAGSLWSFWYTLGYLAEGRQWLEKAFALDGEAPADVRGQALHAAGSLAWAQGDLAEAEKLLTEGLALRREIGDSVELGHTVNNLGLVVHARGDYEQALTLLTESMELRREAGDMRGLAATLGNVAMIAYVRGDYAQGMAYLEEGLTLRRQLGDRAGEVTSLNDLAAMATAQGNYLLAQGFADEAIPLAKVLGDKLGLAYALGTGGIARRLLGDYEQSEKMLSEAIVLFQEAGYKSGLTDVLEHLAAIAGATGRFERAARLYGAAEALRESIGLPRDPPSVPEYECSLTAAREQVDERTWELAWAEGRAMSSDQVLSYALGESIGS